MLARSILWKRKKKKKKFPRENYFLLFHVNIYRSFQSPKRKDSDLRGREPSSAVLHKTQKRSSPTPPNNRNSNPRKRRTKFPIFGRKQNAEENHCAQTPPIYANKQIFKLEKERKKRRNLTSFSYVKKTII